MFGIGPGELAVIAVLFLVIFGPDKVPQMARDIGKFTNEARRAIEDFREDITQMNDDEDEDNDEDSYAEDDEDQDADTDYENDEDEERRRQRARPLASEHFSLSVGQQFSNNGSAQTYSRRRIVIPASAVKPRRRQCNAHESKNLTS